MPTAIDSSAPVSATDDKTQSVAGYKRRAPTAAAGPYSASNLQAAIHHNAAKETEEAVKAKPVDQGERRATPEDSTPLVADAVLGLRDGRKLLPCCEDCHAAQKKPLSSSPHCHRESRFYTLIRRASP